MRLRTFHENIYESIMENDETWFIYEEGSALIVYDAQMMDC